METKIIGELKKYKIGKQYETQEKIFLKGGVVVGKLAEQREKGHSDSGMSAYRYRKVIIVKEDDEMYAIPVQYLSPIEELESDVNSELDKIKEQLGTLSKEVTTKGEKVLKREYFGFSGKEILIGAVVLIVLLKINK